MPDVPTIPRRLSLLLLLALAAAPGCGGPAPGPAPGGDETTGSRPLRVVATTGMIADVVRAVAGDRAEVETLMGAGIDPHLYRPTRSDVARITRADAVFANGLHLEGRMTDALARAASAGRRVVAVAETIDPSRLLAPPDLEKAHDPHVWMDPVLWAETIDVVRRTLTELDPEGEADHAANGARYLAELRPLDAYAARVLASVPEDRRVLVTAHDAFGYLGRRFGYEVVGIQGLSTESEAGVRDIERLVDLLVDRRIAAVFVESTVSQRNVDALVAGARARGHEVAIGGELFSDALGPPGTYEGTYVGMIDHNATVIARSLGGDAPAGGMDGRLAIASEDASE